MTNKQSVTELLYDIPLAGHIISAIVHQVHEIIIGTVNTWSPSIRQSWTLVSRKKRQCPTALLALNNWVENRMSGIIMTPQIASGIWRCIHQAPIYFSLSGRPARTELHTNQPLRGLWVCMPDTPNHENVYICIYSCCSNSSVFQGANRAENYPYQTNNTKPNNNKNFVLQLLVRSL